MKRTNAEWEAICNSYAQENGQFHAEIDRLRAALAAAQGGGEEAWRDGFAVGWLQAVEAAAVKLIHCRDEQKGKCCDDCYCVALANAFSAFRALRPPAAPTESEVMPNQSAHRTSLAAQQPEHKTSPLSASAPAGAQPSEGLKLPPWCEECGGARSDPPSKLCPGCQAYREHQR